MSERSGIAWCARFPGSRLLTDLAQPFRGNAAAFIEAIRDAGASVQINATYRPPERAYLMHFCCLVAGYRDAQQIFHQIGAGDVPPMVGVDIDWTCGGDPGAAKVAAVQMREGFGIAFPAALVSNHTRRLAIDMTVKFKGALAVRTKYGTTAMVACQSDLWPVGKSYGVLKLATDEPHWSIDGH